MRRTAFEKTEENVCYESAKTKGNLIAVSVTKKTVIFMINVVCFHNLGSNSF